MGNAAPASGAPIAQDGDVRVLVVDDHPDVRHLLETDLALAGLDVESAGSIAEARRRLREGGIDCVVTDRWLDDGDGEAFAVTAGVPTVVMSGSYETRGSLGGRTVRLPKPFRTRALVELLHTIA